MRNDRLHGLDDSDVPPTIAALALIAAVHLAFLGNHTNANLAGVARHARRKPTPAISLHF